VSFLLDTDAISEIRRGHDPNVRAWAAGVADADLYLSALTIGEIRKGIEGLRLRDPSQADVFSRWLEQLHGRFATRILSISAQIAEEWGRLNVLRTLNTVDSLIAATARIHELTVVTRNLRDFQGCEVQLLDPWSHQSP
jgi:predicted nucleic acid-binding protein